MFGLCLCFLFFLSENSNRLNSSASLRQSQSASKTQASKKITSSPRSPRPKDSRPNNATTNKPQNRHLAPKVSQSSSKPQGKTSKSTNEARPASCQSVKSLKSSGISKSSKDNVVNTASEARQQIYQSSKRPHSSPSLKKGSSDAKDGAKPMTSEPSKRPTSSPTKGQKQQQSKSCQPERPNSSSSMKKNLPVLKSKVKATQRCPQGTVRPKSSQSNDKNTSETNRTVFQPKSRPRSSPAFKGNPTEATNEVIKRRISNHLSKNDMPKTNGNVKRKSCPSLKSPVSRPASAEGNLARTVETCVTEQQAAQEAKADPSDHVLEDGDTPKTEDVGDNFQSTSQVIEYSTLAFMITVNTKTYPAFSS